MRVILKFMRYILMIQLLFWGFMVQLHAQRVLEVESSIKNDIEGYVNRVLPNTKYALEVKVIPLRKSNNPIYAPATSLPYMDVENDFAVDEWDNPEASLYSLYSRIKKVQVDLFLDPDVKLANEKEFVSRLFTEAHLVEGRDNIKIDAFRSSVVVESFSWKRYKDELFLGIMLIGIFIFAHLISNIGLNIANRKALGESSGKNNSSGSNIQAPPLTAVMASAREEQGQMSSTTSSSASGELLIQDPTKINETVHKKIDQLIKSPIFPCLQDMITLEKLASDDISSFSYLVYEFPAEIQEKIYSYGRNQSWFLAFSQVGLPTKDVLITLDMMLRNRNINFSPSFEKLLISLWRLEGQLKQVISELDKDSALKILAFLPKDMAIPVARELFPGSWGGLFEIDKAKSFLKDKEIERIANRAIHIKELFNFETLKDFKDEKDLLAYLDTVGPKEEREIYAVLGNQSDVKNIRPPFFQLFDLDTKILDEIKTSFSLEQWGLALLNVDHNDREVITSLFDDKERYLFSEYLKSYGQRSDSHFYMEQKNIRKEIAAKVMAMNENITLETQNISRLEEKMEPDLNDVA